MKDEIRDLVKCLHHAMRDWQGIPKELDKMIDQYLSDVDDDDILHFIIQQKGQFDILKCSSAFPKLKREDYRKMAYAIRRLSMIFDSEAATVSYHAEINGLYPRRLYRDIVLKKLRFVTSKLNIENKLGEMMYQREDELLEEFVMQKLTLFKTKDTSNSDNKR